MAGSDAIKPAADLALAAGLALAPASAAQCILDTNRTVAFLRGVWSAVRQTRLRLPSETIEVVYAGTGPFAPLAIPLMGLQATEGVRFTLIDAHQQSIASVTRLVKHFGLEAFVREIVHADAVMYEHPTPIHVLVTETMQQALKTEPFVEIVRNLRRQLVPGGVLVPACVAVSVAPLRAPSLPARRAAGESTTVFQITAAADTAASPDGPPGPVVVNVPAGWVALFTDIEVSPGNVLKDYESGLTTPEMLWPLSGTTRGESAIAFHYETGEAPGIRWSVL